MENLAAERTVAALPGILNALPSSNFGEAVYEKQSDNIIRLREPEILPKPQKQNRSFDQTIVQFGQLLIKYSTATLDK